MPNAPERLFYSHFRARRALSPRGRNASYFKSAQIFAYIFIPHVLPRCTLGVRGYMPHCVACCACSFAIRAKKLGEILGRNELRYVGGLQKKFALLCARAVVLSAFFRARCALRPRGRNASCFKCAQIFAYIFIPHVFCRAVHWECAGVILCANVPRERIVRRGTANAQRAF